MKRHHISIMASFKGHEPYQRFCRKFTLIELLITIAIIAILAGMLLPALSKARAKGQAILCMSNIKQSGTMLLLYADTFGGWYPPPLPYRVGGKAVAGTLIPEVVSSMSWAGRTAFYNEGKTREDTLLAKTYAKYRCPIFGTERDPKNDELLAYQITFGMNVFLGGGVWDDNRFVHTSQIARKNGNWETRVLSKTILLGDSYTADNTFKCQSSRLNGYSSQKMHLRHENRGNALMCDGSARPVGYDSLIAVYRATKSCIVDENLNSFP